MAKICGFYVNKPELYANILWLLMLVQLTLGDGDWLKWKTLQGRSVYVHYSSDHVTQTHSQTVLSSAVKHENTKMWPDNRSFNYERCSKISKTPPQSIHPLGLSTNSSCLLTMPNPSDYCYNKAFCIVSLFRVFIGLFSETWLSIALHHH